MTESKRILAGKKESKSPDPGTDSMFERTLRRTPAQRLADATRIARFVLRTREKVRAATHG
jgi:hypothetical protein